MSGNQSHLPTNSCPKKKPCPEKKRCTKPIPRINDQPSQPSTSVPKGVAKSASNGKRLCHLLSCKKTGKSSGKHSTCNASSCKPKMSKTCKMVPAEPEEHLPRYISLISEPPCSEPPSCPSPFWNSSCLRASPCQLSLPDSSNCNKSARNCSLCKTESRKEDIYKSPCKSPVRETLGIKETAEKRPKDKESGMPLAIKSSRSKSAAYSRLENNELHTKGGHEKPVSTSTSKVPSIWFNSPAQEALRKSFLATINKERLAVSLPPLTLNAELNKCAAKHNYDQAFVMNGIYHTGSDGSKLSDRLKRTGYSYRWAGENVAHRQETVEWVVDSLMKSPGHRKNIVNEKAEQMGIHGGVGKDGYWYWTQVLAAPY